MPDFANMTLTQLIDPRGYECDCGKHHAADCKYLAIERGAVNKLPEALAAAGAKKPFVVYDRNTYKAAGKRVEEVLTAANVPFVLYEIPEVNGEKLAPAERELGSIVMHFDPSCDFVLAIGGGVINDLCKVTAHAVGRLSGIVGTAPSMDGFASNSSSMEVDQVKTTLYNRTPAVIVLDTEIMAQAPMRMLWAGLGDMVAKYISVCEWRITNLINGEYYCESVADMMRAALRKIMAASDKITSRDPDAIGSVAEGLVLAGLAMSYAEVSRPASGLEHYFSHMWEMLALERGKVADLHGIQVGVGTILTMKIYERIRKITPDRARAEKAMADFDPQAWAENVRRVFGKTAPAVLAIEAKAGKNDPAKHAKRLDAILAHWDEIQQIIAEELPTLDYLKGAMAQTGMPMTPADLGISTQDVVDAFVCSRDIRDKYLSGSLLWDIGWMDEIAAWLPEVCNEK